MHKLFGCLYGHDNRVVVAAKVEVGREVTHAFQRFGVEQVVDAEHSFAVAIGVHIAVATTLEAVFQQRAETAVGVG